MKARATSLGLELRNRFGNYLIARVSRGQQIFSEFWYAYWELTWFRCLVGRKYTEGEQYYKNLRLTATDKTALACRARLDRQRLNTYQYFQKLYLTTRRDLPTMPFCSRVQSYTTIPGQIYIYCEAQTGLNMHVGINLRLNNSFQFSPMTEIPGTGKYQGTISGLISMQKYLFIFNYIDPSGNPRLCSGVYWEKPT